jgi:N6-adenosine-specific RNA methylase IME4/predicted transcriptional regulator
MKREDAEAFTLSLERSGEGFFGFIQWAHDNDVPKALGYRSTKEWVNQRVGGYIKIDIGERRELAKKLTGEGYSQRDAADILGVSLGTVNSDVADGVQDRTLDAGEEPQEAPTDVQNRTNEADLTQSKKREAALREQLKVAQTPIVSPSKRYGAVVIDPPWPMKKIEREVRPNQVEFDYPTMDEDQLRAWGRQYVLPIMADDCHFFMWTTHKFLPMALRLFDDYGLKYVLTMVWHKPGGFQPVGLPQYNCEFAIYGRAGSPKFVDTKAFNVCFTAPRAEHSRKPDEFYDMVRRVTEGDRIDIFSREKRDGFDQLGNELAKFTEAA